MRYVLQFVDTISEFTGRLAAWTFFVIGLIVTYEVVMRYVFNAPTVWVDEIARIMQIWATYIAAAFVLKNRQLIVIDIAFRNAASMSRKVVETLSMVVILMFAGVATWFGFEQWLAKTLIGDKTDTFLGVPKWITISSIWIGFGLLFLQAVAELIKIWTIGLPQQEEVVH